jgi:hypothetical protein
MPIEIRETIVTPTPRGDLIQLHISDVAPDAEGATFRLVLLAKLPPLEPSLLAQMQRSAMTMAQDALTPILQRLAQEITERAGRPLNPNPRQNA